MAFSGDYAEATITNPGSALTDFTLLVDLSRMPASWWSAVDTADGTKGRASKDDGTTELACDWIDFDNTAETGWLRVKWSGTLASSGTQKLRIYPPVSGNASVAVDAEFGQYNAYDFNTKAYYPLDGDANNRKSASYDLSGTNNPTAILGKVGGGYDYNSGDSEYHEADISPVTALPLTVMLWVRSNDDDAAEEAMFYYGNKEPAGVDQFVCAQFEASDDTLVIWARDIELYYDTGQDYYDQSWHHIAFTYRNGGAGRQLEAYHNGVSIGTDDSSNATRISDFDRVSLGRRGDNSPGQYLNGDLDDVWIRSDDLSVDWIAEEYAQANDQSSFWGSWTWETAAEDYTLECDHGSFTLSGQAASLLAGRKLSASHGSYSLSGQAVDLLRGLKLSGEHGTFTLSGQDASLLATRLLTASHGSFSLAGQSADLLRGLLLTAENGSLTLSGQDVDLLRGLMLSADHGSLTLAGQDASLLRGYHLDAEHGTFSLAGQDATLTYSEGAAAYELTAETGYFTLSGQAAALKRGLKLSADHGSLSLSGQAADLLRGYALECEVGTFTLSGQAADLLRGLKLSGEHGTFTLSGQDITLTYSGKTLASGTVEVTFSAVVPKVTFSDVIPTVTFTAINPKIKFTRKE